MTRVGTLNAAMGGPNNLHALHHLAEGLLDTALDHVVVFPL
jgi:hypothetical protein